MEPKEVVVLGISSFVALAFLISFVFIQRRICDNWQKSWNYMALGMSFLTITIGSLFGWSITMLEGSFEWECAPFITIFIIASCCLAVIQLATIMGCMHFDSSRFSLVGSGIISCALASILITICDYYSTKQSCPESVFEFLQHGFLTTWLTEGAFITIGLGLVVWGRLIVQQGVPECLLRRK